MTANTEHDVGQPVPLTQGAFAVLAYRLGRSRSTGVLTVFGQRARRPDVLVLRRGHLMAADTDALGRRTRQHLERLCSMSDVSYVFDGGTVAYPPGAADRQFSLAAWARSHFEAQLDAQRATTLVSEFTGVHMFVAGENMPDASLCDATDKRILDALAAPRRLDQIWHRARTPRFRLLSFLHFLRCVGALELEHVHVPAPSDRPASGDSAHQILGVSPDADRTAVKRAYRRLARTLHPDLHPHATADHRKHLERRLRDVTEAYSELVS